MYQPFHLGLPTLGERQVVGPSQVAIDQGSEHRNDGLGLLDRGWAKVDLFVVERPERGEGIGLAGTHADPAGATGGVNHGAHEHRNLIAPPKAAHIAYPARKLGRMHQTGALGVFEVMANVGNAIGPGHDLTLRCGRRRS